MGLCFALRSIRMFSFSRLISLLFFSVVAQRAGFRYIPDDHLDRSQFALVFLYFYLLRKQDIDIDTRLNSFKLITTRFLNDLILLKFLNKVNLFDLFGTF